MDDVKKTLPPVHAVIVAAGSSSRMGGRESKIFVRLGGKNVIFRSVEAFAKHPYITDITVVVRAGEEERVKEELRPLSELKPLTLVTGGEERTDSVAAGVDSIAEDDGIVAIHDGARPLVSERIISEAAEAAHIYGGAVPAVPVKDTVRIAGEDGFALPSPPRETLRAVQTPQCFALCEFREALKAARERRQAGERFTDDAGVFELAGKRIRLTEGSYDNLKITTPEDVAAAEGILERREVKQ